MTAEQRQELLDLETNLSSFESNAEVQLLVHEIQEALTYNITLREYRKRKKRLRKEQPSN